MKLRMETLNCLKERLLNIRSEGKVFATARAQSQWLLGDEASSPGLVRDPKSALAATLDFLGSEVPPHPGVQITPEEESEIRRFVGRLLAGGRSLLAHGNGQRITPAGLALDCPNDLDPKCWYN